MDREVFFHPAQTEDKIKGVSVDYWMDDTNTSPLFNGQRFQEYGEKLGNNTLAFLRFLGDFVGKIDNNLIVNPSDEKRERLYAQFFKNHGPVGHNVYVRNEVIIKREPLEPTSVTF